MSEKTIHELIFGDKTIEEVRQDAERTRDLIRSGKLRTVITGPCCAGVNPNFVVQVNPKPMTKAARDMIAKEVSAGMRRIIGDMHTQAVYYMVNPEDRHGNR